MAKKRRKRVDTRTDKQRLVDERFNVMIGNEPEIGDPPKRRRKRSKKSQ